VRDPLGLSLNRTGFGVLVQMEQRPPGIPQVKRTVGAGARFSTDAGRSGSTNVISHSNGIVPQRASIAFATFAAVMMASASNRLHLTVAAFLGVVALLVTGVLSTEEASETINPGEATIALFFGGMVMARVLTPTGLQRGQRPLRPLPSALSSLSEASPRRSDAAAVLEPLKVRSSGNLGMDKTDTGMPGPGRPCWQRHRRRWHPPRRRRRRRPNLPRNKRLRSHLR